jgi:hypothetical protein
MDTDTEANLRHGVPWKYDPGRLIDMMILRTGAKNDIELGGWLGVHHKVIRNMREGRLCVSPSMLVWMQNITGLSIYELRTLLGDRRAKLRPACSLLSR